MYYIILYICITVLSYYSQLIIISSCECIIALLTFFLYIYVQSCEIEGHEDYLGEEDKTNYGHGEDDNDDEYEME